MITVISAWNCLRQSVPFLICLFLILLALCPGLAIAHAPFTFIFIFYFSLFHASLLNDWACFLLGVITDLTIQTPFGITPFLYVLLFFTTHINRLFLIALSSQKLWMCFSLAMCILFSLWFFLFSLCSGTVIGVGTLFVQYVVLVLLYPAVMRFCGLLDSWIREPV